MFTRGAAAGALGALGAWLVARSPAAVSAWPALGLLRGPLAWGLALATATQILGRRTGPALERALARRPALLALAAFVLLAAVGRHYSAGLHPSGDEPHYLLMAQSLLREGDLDLRDNFERGDFREYAPDLAAPHYGAPRADGRPFPAHSPGLPLLLAPAYALGGRAACVVLMALLAALAVAQVAPLARRLGASEPAAAFAALAACGPPLGIYAFHVYTEVPSALALAATLRLLLGDETRRRATLAAAGAALLASTLPWLHVKMVPAAAVLGLIAVARLRGRARLLFVAVAGLMAAGFLGYYASVFGRATPLALYGGGLPRGVEPDPLRAAAGLLLDRSFGLLPHAPVFLLALAGLPRLLALAARRHPAALAHVLVAAAVLVPVLSWRMWWGGQCAPARFLVPIVPLLAAAMALRLSRPADDAGAPAARGLAGLRFTLLALGAALATFMVARPADLLLLNRRDRPTRVWEALAGSTPAGPVSLGDYLPSLVLPSDAEAARAALWLAFVAALLAWDAWRARRAGGAG